ncbi:nijmegen breakage syndrome 1 protein isoform X1 [Amborella trichopoda]|uniref:nijmegen breakage syndrome 1 protein isoform X1 n=1 Tax=Amborella trichopoda TaxID=13333 RepID=UPI0005D43CAF|nr:nijmegen breakage syndrome 1 protein isoform X1 [Amborella trichopoda]|eukprot:XP_011624625.1 nijmegen breakage syndrome 1 protein isoform X1 [Amborella trichopoda]
MVWELSSMGSSQGMPKHYICSKGIYKVGRKGCDIIIQTDRTISRVHAEIIVDLMSSWDPSQSKSSNLPSNVSLLDLSKFGTFINKNTESKPVFSFPNKVTTLRNGDLITFGTGDASFRFSYIPLLIYIHFEESFKDNNAIEDMISMIGASATRTWTGGCTHALVNEHSLVTVNLLDAVVAKQPVILSSWVQAVAEKKVSNEIPSCSTCIPTLTLGEGEHSSSVKVVEPTVRESCLAGYTFVLRSSHMYTYGERLRLLLEVVGAKVLSLDSFHFSNQILEDGASKLIAHVIPSGSENDIHTLRSLNSISRVNEVKLVACVLSGHLDPSILELPSLRVSSSHSTDETIVADSDVDTDTATSDRVAALVQSKKSTSDEERGSSNDGLAKVTAEERTLPSEIGEDGGIIVKSVKDESDAPSLHNSDIIYTQDLIVRNGLVTSNRNKSSSEAINFKRFRKREVPSGNSFRDLIPFSKYPYKESDYGSEVADFRREEKKRKEMEAVADDLFNSEKVKRQRGTTASSLFGSRSQYSSLGKYL